jgi:hypothetical protein
MRIISDYRLEHNTLKIRVEQKIAKSLLKDTNIFRSEVPTLYSGLSRAKFYEVPVVATIYLTQFYRKTEIKETCLCRPLKLTWYVKD